MLINTWDEWQKSVNEYCPSCAFSDTCSCPCEALLEYANKKKKEAEA